jgi:hypothetical protein
VWNDDSRKTIAHAERGQICLSAHCQNIRVISIVLTQMSLRSSFSVSKWSFAFPTHLPHHSGSLLSVANFVNTQYQLIFPYSTTALRNVKTSDSVLDAIGDIKHVNEG